MLDSILRATNSSIRDRVLAELGPLRKVGRQEIPKEVMRSSATPISLWARTRWFQNQYVEQPRRKSGAAVTNMFSTDAPELQGLVRANVMHCQFTQVASWLELAHPIWDYARWAPECATHNYLNVPRTTPPIRTTPIQLGYNETRNREHRGDSFSRQLAVYTAVSKIENRGFTANILKHRGGIVLRSGVMRGIILGDVPAHL